MTPESRWIYAVTFLLASAGFLVPFWPLSAIGILLCALSGRFVFAVFIALLIDIAQGAPTGLLSYVLFPHTVLALLAALARLYGARFFLDRNLPEKI